MNDRRAMDSKKAFRIKLAFHPAHGLPQQMRFAPNVQCDIIAARLDPVNVFNWNNHNLLASLRCEMVVIDAPITKFQHSYKCKMFGPLKRSPTFFT